MPFKKSSENTVLFDFFFLLNKTIQVKSLTITSMVWRHQPFKPQNQRDDKMAPSVFTSANGLMPSTTETKLAATFSILHISTARFRNMKTTPTARKGRDVWLAFKQSYVVCLQLTTTLPSIKRIKPLHFCKCRVLCMAT